MKSRKSLRLKGYDYSKPGYYFVTIRSGNKNYPFCSIVDGEVHLNEIGVIIEEQWKWLFDRYDHILIDEYVIMPDHFHAIIRIVSGTVGDGRDRPLQCQKRKSLPELIGAFSKAILTEKHEPFTTLPIKITQNPHKQRPKHLLEKYGHFLGQTTLSISKAT